MSKVIYFLGCSFVALGIALAMYGYRESRAFITGNFGIPSFLIFFVGLCFFVFLYFAKQSRFTLRLDVLYLLFFLALCFGVLCSLIPEVFLWQANTSLTIFLMNIVPFLFILFFVFLTGIESENFSVLSAKFLFWSGFCFVAVAILMWFGLSVHYGPLILEHEPGYLRLYGSVGNANRLGSIAAVSAISGSFLILFLRYGWVYKICFAVVALGLLWTGSRGALLCFLVGSGVLLAYWMRSSSRFSKVLLTFIGLLGSGLVVLLLFPGPLLNFLEDSLRLEGLSHLGHRTNIWISAFNILENSSVFNFLFGHGNGHFSRVDRSTHNAYIRFLIDYGLLFSVAFFVFIFVSVMKVFFHYFEPDLRRGPVLAAALLGGILINNITATPLFSTLTHMNFAFFLVVLILARTDPNITSVIGFRLNRNLEKQQSSSGSEQ